MAGSARYHATEDEAAEEAEVSDWQADLLAAVGGDENAVVLVARQSGVTLIDKRGGGHPVRELRLEAAVRAVRRRFGWDAEEPRRHSCNTHAWLAEALDSDEKPIIIVARSDDCVIVDQGHPAGLGPVSGLRLSACVELVRQRGLGGAEPDRHMSSPGSAGLIDAGLGELTLARLAERNRRLQDDLERNRKHTEEMAGLLVEAAKQDAKAAKELRDIMSDAKGKEDRVSGVGWRLPCWRRWPPR